MMFVKMMNIFSGNDIYLLVPEIIQRTEQFKLFSLKWRKFRKILLDKMHFINQKGKINIYDENVLKFDKAGLWLCIAVLLQYREEVPAIRRFLRKNILQSISVQSTFGIWA